MFVISWRYLHGNIQMQMFFKKSVLKIFAIFTGKKKLCWSLFLIKTPTQVLSCEYCKIFKKRFFYREAPVAASEYCRTYCYFISLLTPQWLCEKCPYSGFFWSAFSRILTEYGKIRTRKSPNTDFFYIMFQRIKLTIKIYYYYYYSFI